MTRVRGCGSRKSGYGWRIRARSRFTARRQPNALRRIPQTLQSEVFNEFSIFPFVSLCAEFLAEHQSEDRKPAFAVAAMPINPCAKTTPAEVCHMLPIPKRCRAATKSGHYMFSTIYTLGWQVSRHCVTNVSDNLSQLRAGKNLLFIRPPVE